MGWGIARVLFCVGVIVAVASLVIPIAAGQDLACAPFWEPGIYRDRAARITIAGDINTCRVEDSHDKVQMSIYFGSSHDYDNGPPGEPSPRQDDRLDRAGTKWSTTGGILDSATGTSNAWTAPATPGTYGVTAALVDYVDGADGQFDDPDVALRAVEVIGL